MKLSGRITVFGEYLLHQNLGPCLVLKSKTFLDNKGIKSKTEYNQDFDSCKILLEKKGFSTSNSISGNLPIGYGMASSTVLIALHLNSLKEKSLIKLIDKEICGFVPSDLDYTSINNQKHGIYVNDSFKSIDINLKYSLFRCIKEKKIKLSDIKKRIQWNRGLQIILAKKIAKFVFSNGHFDFDSYNKYCLALNECKVYSKPTLEIFEIMSNYNVYGKCIGGLYDKALLFVHENSNMKVEFDSLMLKLFPNNALIE